MFNFEIQLIWNDRIQSRDNNSHSYEIPTKRKQTWYSVLGKAFQAIFKVSSDSSLHFYDGDDTATSF